MLWMNRIISIAYRLWQSIIWKSQLNLSKILYYISSNLTHSLNHYSNKSENLHQNQEESNLPTSQIEKVRKKNIVKVAIVHNRAFWVKDNKFWTSKIVDGYIDDVHAEEIDAHSLSKKELDMLLEILDELSS